MSGGRQQGLSQAVAQGLSPRIRAYYPVWDNELSGWRRAAAAGAVGGSPRLSLKNQQRLLSGYCKLYSPGELLHP